VSLWEFLQMSIIAFTVSYWIAFGSLV
jgi:hypothetical protein